MDIYILRHGIAEDVSASGSDRDRVLTAEGIDKTKSSAKAIRKLGLEFDAIFSSPFPRALQTAGIVAAELGCSNLVQTRDALASGSRPEAALEDLRKAAVGKASVLVAGHEPMLSAIISILISGSPHLSITMKKGGLCKLACVRPEPGSARLEWLLTSKHLCRMA